MTQALVIVDIQNDYFPGGALPLEGSPEAGEQAAKLLAAFREKKLPIIHVQHLSTRPGATFFLPNTIGADIHPLVRPQEGEKHIVKHAPSAFKGTDLLDHLKAIGADHLVVAGMMTHMCIDSTVRAAFDLGFGCTLARDACATRALVLDGKSVPAAQVNESFLAAMNGLFAKLASSDEIIQAL